MSWLDDTWHKIPATSIRARVKGLSCASCVRDTGKTCGCQSADLATTRIELAVQMGEIAINRSSTNRTVYPDCLLFASGHFNNISNSLLCSSEQASLMFPCNFNAPNPVRSDTTAVVQSDPVGTLGETELFANFECRWS